jgi:uncharacterized protein (DUF1697 family)
MSDLKAMCEAIGFQDVRTYIASGNVVFRSGQSERVVKEALEAQLRAYAGKPVGVTVRTAGEMAQVAAQNPFPNASGNHVAAIFLDEVTSPAVLDGVVGRADDEEIRLGRREIYVRYGAGMGKSKLRIPAAKDGTARNMNTVAKLAEMAAG